MPSASALLGQLLSDRLHAHETPDPRRKHARGTRTKHQARSPRLPLPPNWRRGSTLGLSEPHVGPCGEEAQRGALFRHSAESRVPAGNAGAALKLLALQPPEPLAPAPRTPGTNLITQGFDPVLVQPVLPATRLGSHGHPLHLPVQHADDVLEGGRLLLQGLAPLQQLRRRGGRCPRARRAGPPAPLALAEEGAAVAWGGPGLQDAQQQGQVLPEPLRLVLLLPLALHLPRHDARAQPQRGPAAAHLDGAPAPGGDTRVTCPLAHLPAPRLPLSALNHVCASQTSLRDSPVTQVTGETRQKKRPRLGGGRGMKRIFNSPYRPGFAATSLPKLHNELGGSDSLKKPKMQRKG